MESCLTGLGKRYVEKLIDGAIAELRHVFCYTCIANEFEEEKDRLDAEIKTLEQRAKVAAGRDNDIQANVLSWKNKADNFIQEDIKTKQTCFFGLCPHCIWRYKKGKELASHIEEIKRLTEKGEKLENIELPRRLPDVERYSSKDYISFQSRESKYKQLLDALKDDSNYIIGLQGMGGTGKTTLAKELGKELKRSEQFAHVIDTTVSFTPDTKKIQDDIAGPLGLKFGDCNDSDRPKKLWSRLTNGEKVLLILDDVWDQGPPLDFELIGIPKRDNHEGCRVLITTRSKRIFYKMECDKMIELELLSEEEAWTMFKMYANVSNSSSKNLITKGRQIAKECKQLPIAIAVIASSLKGQQLRKHEWDATLNSLKKDVSMNGVDDKMVGVYKCLKFSYDYMKDEKAKGLFLLSSVFPEDKEIPIEIITRLGIGTGLFGEDYDNYNDARNQVVVAKNKLIDSCLLMGVGEEHVKLHDLVREVAQWIANKEIQSVNLSNKDKKSLVERETNIKYLFCEGKDMDLFSCKYDGSKLETLVLHVERDDNCKCMEVPNSFFENMVKLQVLYFLGNYFLGHGKRLLSMSHSIHSLTNIRSILVDEFDLGDISVLGNLQSLETLDLVGCTINELPHEIAKLGKFKLLNLEECEIRRNDPFKVIERCSKLEELYFIDSFNDFCREISLPELQRYRIRKGRWWSTIHDSLSKYVSFDAGDDECFFSKETFKYCMQTTEGLQLNGIKEGWRNLMPEIVPIDLGMNDLVELRLSCISQLQYLIDTNGSQVPKILFKLVVLKLDTMENLVELFNGSISFDFLKNLEKLSIKECKMFRRLSNCKLNLCNLKTVTLQKCPMLVSLFPLLSSWNLVLLEKLKIADCERLKNMIIDERREEESREEIDDDDNENKHYVSMFPKLKVLDIEGCHRLESILPFLSFQDLPVLEVIIIKRCDELKYIFGQYQHAELSSLKQIQLCQLPNFIGIFPKYSHSMSSLANESSSTSRDGIKAQIQLDPIKCNIFSWSCICCHGNNYRHKLGRMSTTKIPSVHEDPPHNNSIASVSNSHCLQLWERAQCLPVQSHIMCNIKDITLSGFLKIKSVFILSITPRMLVETLRIKNCDELKHIIVDIGDDDSGGNNWANVFPKLKTLSVQNCMQLEYIFGHYTNDHQNYNEIHLHLPALECLKLRDLPSLVSMCPKQYCTTFPPLKELEIMNFSLDNTIMKELSGTTVYNSNAGNIFCLNEIEEQQMNLGLQMIELHDLHYMMCLFVVSKNSFALQNLTKIKIVRCEILEIVFSTSILRFLSQLIYLKIEECKELKHVIKDDRQNHNLSSWTCFPKLKALVVIKCHKLKCVFPVSTCKELPELKALMIGEADELEEIFKSEGDQKVEIPNLNTVAFFDLPSLFHTQGILFQMAKYRRVQNCQKLSLTSASTPSFFEIFSLCIDHETSELMISLLLRLEDETKGDTGNENPSAESTKDIVVGVEIEVEAALGHKLTSSQIQMKQTLESEHELVENVSDLETPSVAILPTNSKKMEKEQQTSKKCLINQQDPLGEKIDTTIKPSQGVEEGTALTNAKTIIPSTQLKLVSSSQEQDVGIGVGIEVEATLGQKSTSSQIQMKQTLKKELEFVENAFDLETPSVAMLPTNSKELEKEQPTSQQGLINQQDPLGEIDTTIKPSQCLKETKDQSIQEGYSFKTTLEATMYSVSDIRNGPPIQLVSPKVKGDEEGTALTKAKIITPSTHLELVSSSQEQDVDDRDTLETTKVNDDQVSLNEDVVMKVSSIIEEQFPKGDEFTVIKSKPSSSNSVPLPLAFQAPSMHFKGNPSQKLEDLSSPYLVTRELEELVSKKYLDYENLSLLTDFLVKHPSVLLSDISLSNKYKGYAYNCLAELLKFLLTHSVLDVLGSSHSKFVELLQDVRSFAFDKGWLDGVEKRTLFPDLQFSQDALQKLLDSKKQVTKDVEVVRLKIDILTQNVEDLKQQLSYYEADLESIIQQEKEFVESKAALSAPLGY